MIPKNRTLEGKNQALGGEGGLKYPQQIGNYKIKLDIKGGGVKMTPINYISFMDGP